MNKIFLIRHGESEFNTGLWTTGPVNTALTRHGFAQAKAVALFIEAYTLNLIVTSPYLRTQQTAEPTIKLFPSTLQDVWAVQEFTYLSSMQQPQSTLQQRRARVEAYWKELDPLYRDGPDAESFADFIKRAHTFKRRLEITSCENIAVFGHEQFINAVLWLAKYDIAENSPWAMRNFRDFLDSHSIPNEAIIQVHFRDHQKNWQFEQITSHLRYI